MRSFTFSFDELPLMIERGIEAGLVAGDAEISYFIDGAWGVDEINLDGYRPATEAELIAKSPRYIRQSIALDRGTPLFSIINDRLETEWSGQVQDAVREQLTKDYEAYREAAE